MEIDTPANKILAELLTAHGYSVTYYNGWLSVDQRFPLMSAAVFNERSTGDSVILQLDVRVLLPEEMLIESFAGIGSDSIAALMDGFQNFAANSLHVILGAFFDAISEQFHRETWQINGHRWKATIGNYGVRLGNDDAFTIPDILFDVWKDSILALPLENEWNWTRLYFARTIANPDTCEILLNNAPWSEASERIATLPWEPTNSFYSVRCFLILHRLDEMDPRIN